MCLPFLVKARNVKYQSLSCKDQAPMMFVGWHNACVQRGRVRKWRNDEKLAARPPLQRFVRPAFAGTTGYNSAYENFRRLTLRLSAALLL